MMYAFGYGNRYEWMRGGMVFMMLFGVILIAAIIYIAVRGSSSRGYNHQNVQSNNALDKLNERLAKSEISEEEYNTKKRMISSR